MPDEPRVTAEERVRRALGGEARYLLYKPEVEDLLKAHAAAEVEHATAELRGQKQTLNEILAVEREQKMAAEAEVRRLRLKVESLTIERDSGLAAIAQAKQDLGELTLALERERRRADAPHTED